MSAYSDAIVAEAGLVSYWKLDEASGTNAADVFAGRNGTHQASPTVGVAAVAPAEGGKAVTYARASSQYTSVPDNAAFKGLSGLTVEAWVKFSSLPAPFEAYCVASKPGSWYLMLYNNGGTYQLFCSGNATDGVPAVNWTPSTGTPYHLVFTWTNATNGWKVYVNGAQEGASGTQPSVMASGTEALRIGSQSAASPHHFNGTIDEVAVYNVALSAATIANHYTLGSSITGSIACPITLTTVISGQLLGSPLDCPISVTASMTGSRVGSVFVAAATPGDEYRLYDAADTLLSSAIVDSNGLATILYQGLPVNGYVRGYRAGSPLTGHRWPASGSDALSRDRRTYIAQPDTVTVDRADVIAYDAHFYYPTSQFGGSNSQMVETATKRYVVWRALSADGGVLGRYIVERWDKATRTRDQGPFVLHDGIGDGHQSFVLARAPNGKLRFVWGGITGAPNGGDALQMRETSSADDITAWTAPTTIVSSTYFGGQGEFVYKIGSDGGNHIVLETHPGGDLYYAWSSNASPTGFGPPTRIVQASLGNWGALLGDIALGPGAPGVAEVHVVWGMFGPAEGYETAYRDVCYMKFTSPGSMMKADGTGIASPIVCPAGGGNPPCDIVQDGYHYGTWLKIELVNGQPTILGDGSRDNYDDFQPLLRWNGSAWTNNPVTGLLSNDTGFALIDPTVAGAPRFGNWGTALQPDPNIANRVHVFYADRGPNANLGFRVVRATSDDYGVTWTSLIISDDDFAPWGYEWLNESATYGSGITYPKVADGYPNSVMFGVVDGELDSEVIVAMFPEGIATIDCPIVMTTTLDGFQLVGGGIDCPITVDAAMAGSDMGPPPPPDPNLFRPYRRGLGRRSWRSTQGRGVFSR